MFRNGKNRGICLVSLGAGILLALVLPVGCVIFVCSVLLIAIGVSCMKHK